MWGLVQKAPHRQHDSIWPARGINVIIWNVLSTTWNMEMFYIKAVSYGVFYLDDKSIYSIIPSSQYHTHLNDSRNNLCYQPSVETMWTKLAYFFIKKLTYRSKWLEISCIIDFFHFFTFWCFSEVMYRGIRLSEILSCTSLSLFERSQPLLMRDK